MNNLELDASINKYNSLYLYFIMKAKKKYTKLHIKLSTQDIRIIYKIQVVEQVQEPVIQEPVIQEPVIQVQEQVSVVQESVMQESVVQESVQVQEPELVQVSVVQEVKEVQEQEIYCNPCADPGIKLGSKDKCLCCPGFPSSFLDFPLYEELLGLMNFTQQSLFTKQLYFCTKIIYENRSNDMIIKKMCEKIVELEGVMGLEFVQTILKSIG